MKAVGIHGFAGGFTMGVKKVFDVQAQLEQHNFGRESCEGIAKVPFINDPAANWPKIDAEFAYGNPRCTAFSTITSGPGYTKGGAHGPFARQTADIVSLAKYAFSQDYPIIVFESVQQAFSTGRALLNLLRDDYCKPQHYRIAHVLMSAAMVGSAQNRRRYFFVAYKDDKNFNVDAPKLPFYYKTVWDTIGHRIDNETHMMDRSAEEYDENSYYHMCEEDKFTIPRLPNGWCYNAMGRYFTEGMHPKHQQCWNLRTSDMPFSMHCPFRLQWLRPVPTLFSTRRNMVHPQLHRFVTIGEFTDMMGWPRIPMGKDPVSQMSKGLVPAAGEWIARQVLSYLNDEWGDQDWETRYDHHNGEWVGASTNGALEKVFQLTQYIPRGFDLERFPPEIRLPPHRRVKRENL